ncbi:hypothetical protein CCACVL1_00726, partial [Corchorus capsularis]
MANWPYSHSHAWGGVAPCWNHWAAHYFI